MYSTEHLRSAAFGRQDASAPANEEGHDDDNDELSAHGHVTMEGRPSCMAVSEDNLRVAVAVGDKVGASRYRAIYLIRIFCRGRGVH